MGMGGPAGGPGAAALNRRAAVVPMTTSRLFQNIGLWVSYCTEEDEYNELASLLQNRGHQTVKLLFDEGTGDIFSPEALFIFLLAYSFLAIITAGISVPQGLVIPALIMGGTMGRLFAIIVNKAFKSSGRLDLCVGMLIVLYAAGVCTMHM